MKDQVWVSATNLPTPIDRQPLGGPKPRWLEQVLGLELARIVRGMLGSRVSVAGLVILGLIFLVAALAPVLAPPLNPNKPFAIPRDGFSPIPRPPLSSWSRNQPELPFWYQTFMGRDDWVHLMGTTSGQYDVFYGVVWGTRTALTVGIVIVGFSATIGISVGSVAGFFGGRLDEVLMRITEVFMAFPSLMAALALSAILVPRLGRGPESAVIALTVFGWMTYARLIRGDVLAVKERDYVLAARVIGARNRRILLCHILPNAIFPALVLATLDMGAIVIYFAALSFIGVGVEVGYADWGQLISFSRDWIPNLATYWYIVAFPGLALILFALGWNLVGDALRDVLDPWMRGRGR